MYNSVIRAINQNFKWILTVLVLLNGYVWQPYVGRDSGLLEVQVLDVGQGDSILVRTPDGLYGLIDGGKGDKVLAQLNEVLPWGQRRLDFVISTHPDLDHFEGLIPVMERYDIGALFWTKTDKDIPAYQALKDVVVRKHITNYRISSDYDFRLGCCVDFDVLWPLTTSNTYHVEDANDYSVAVLLKYKDFSMYMGGDLGGDLESQSVSALASDAVDVLKVGHHGSKTSSSLSFLDVIKPKLAIISVGENSYGHPAPQVLNNLSSVGAAVWRTDLLGRITITTPGDLLEIFSEKGVEKMQLRV